MNVEIFSQSTPTDENTITHLLKKTLGTNKGNVLLSATHRNNEYVSVAYLEGLHDIMGLAASLPTLLVWMACHRGSSEHVGGNEISLLMVQSYSWG